ncbi:MAG: hypothetical protein B1H09_01550 [Gemmatimonadaceae bacterium 4484_173]|nr:MAG: hypothetical protein B1H09_01550 [Gemmatimonadaceae bacterium 4484_173]RKZ03212.1 MAG: hypothetical protein DRQ21_06405 [Candidatus Fermentibacteria bacterium]
MLPEERDGALVLDIISAAEDILSFIKECDFKEFSDNKILRYAVERQLLVIGEAARRLSDSFRDNLTEIPWKAVIGLRNIIAHDYGEILTERIWLVASRDLKDLLQKLRPFSDIP